MHCRIQKPNLLIEIQTLSMGWALWALGAGWSWMSDDGPSLLDAQEIEGKLWSFNPPSFLQATKCLHTNITELLFHLFSHCLHLLTHLLTWWSHSWEHLGPTVPASGPGCQLSTSGIKKKNPKKQIIALTGRHIVTPLYHIRDIHYQ